MMHLALMMEAASTSQTLVNFYQTARCNNPRRQPFSDIFILAVVRT
jgi:hypothetical protein